MLQNKSGDPSNAEGLLLLVYDELRKLAAAKLAREKAGQTLQPTALVHEAYLRLVNSSQVQSWDSRGHFFAAAAEAMRRILFEKARRKRIARNVGGSKLGLSVCVEFENGPKNLDLLVLDDALAELEREHPIKAKIVHLRFFAGLTHDEIAAILDLSTITVKRHWRFARVWLHRQLNVGE